MKKLIIAAFFLWSVGFMAHFASAQTPEVSGVNLGSLVSNTRIGVALPLAGGRSFQSVYAPLFTLHGADKGVEYAGLNVGAAAYTGSTKGYAVCFPSVRLDTLLDRFTGISAWTRAHITTAKLPKLEAGVGGLLFDGKVRWVANLAIRF